jgi:choline dehydrogenase-like flavoprotein
MIALTDDRAVVVIGSGAGGGTVAHELTARGIDVVLLEAGRRIETPEFQQDELAAFGQLSWLDPRTASGDWGAATYAANNPAWTVKAVGGATVHWNGFSFRLQAHEFKPRSTYGAIEGANLIDWPISLEELAPWYAQAEDKMGVTGAHGLKRHPYTNNYKVLWNGAKRIGYTQVRNDRLAINVESRDDRAGCLQFGFCNQGCLSGAKWSTLVSEIPKAEATGKLTLRTQAMAMRIEHDAQGKITGVVYKDAAGAEQRQKARVVVVACGGVETPRLLLLSASAQFPNGLANRSGQVGRNFMRHTQFMSFGRFDRPVHMHRGIVTPGYVADEARHDPKRGFAGGYLIESVALHPTSLALLLDPNGWGQAYAGFLDRYDHLAGALMIGEDLPRADNRITLNESVKDAIGLPVANIHVDEHASAHALRKHGWGQAQAIFEAAGAKDVRHGIPFSATHCLGTARMSASADEGVTNSYGRAHDHPNLFIADGGLLTSSGAENPTLTIVALAIRQADHIAKAMARGDL